MTTNLLLNTSSLKILISDSEVGPHLLKSLIGDSGDTKLLLTLSEVKPKLAPCRVTRSLTEEVGQLLTAVAAGQGCLVGIVGRHFDFLCHYHWR